MSAPEKQIYFIRPVGAVGPIKIGCSRWVDERLASLMLWSPTPLEVITYAEGDVRLEFCVHRMFADHRLHKEWFAPAPALLEAIDRVKAGQSILDAFGIEVGAKMRWGRMEAVYRPAITGRRAA